MVDVFIVTDQDLKDDVYKMYAMENKMGPKDWRNYELDKLRTRRITNKTNYKVDELQI